MRLSWFWARLVLGKSWLRENSTGTVGANTSLWFGLIAPVSRKNYTRANFSVTPRARLPVQSETELVVLRRQPAGLCFSTRLVKFPWNYKVNYSAFYGRNVMNALGEERTRRADVRIIAATNRDLKKEVAAGRFREDLYYRLNIVPVKVVPLRNRKEDIALLAAHFVDVTVKEIGCRRPRLTPAGIDALLAYDWPGNVRELRNVIERACITAQGGALEFDLPVSRSPININSFGSKRDHKAKPEFLTNADFRRRERENLFIVLQKTGWKIKGADGAAELLGLKPTTLISRIEKTGLTRPLDSVEWNRVLWGSLAITAAVKGEIHVAFRTQYGQMFERMRTA
jgi:hypothetical protein